MPTRLNDAERKNLSQTLPGWTLVNGRDAIERNLQFRDFSEAWGFMNRVALLLDCACGLAGHHCTRFRCPTDAVPTS